MEENKITEKLKIVETMKIDAFQSGGLVLHTRRLAELTNQCSNTPDVTCLATSVIVMAAAAMETLLAEAAFIIEPELYAKKNFDKLVYPRNLRC